MNRVQLSGNLTRDPEVRNFTTKNKEGEKVESKVANYSLAINIVEGRKQDNPAFIRCSSFGKTAEIVGKNAKQGDKLIVEGRLIPNNYKKDGVSIYSTDVIVDSVEFCGGKRDEQSENQVENNDGDSFMDIPENDESGLPAPF